MEKSSTFKFPLQVREDVTLTTPRIDEVLTQFRQRIASEAITDPVAQIRSTVSDPADPVNEQRIRKLEHQVSQLIQKVLISHCWKPSIHVLGSICTRYTAGEEINILMGYI